MKTPHALSPIKRMVSLCALALGTVIASACFPAHAEDMPFQMDGGHWMSFDHYKDADKRGILPVAKPVSIATEGTPDIAGAVPESANASGDSTAIAVAAPVRPLNLPPMPALEKGFMVRINSTEDDIVTQAPPVIAADTASDIQLADKNWQNPASVTSKASINGDDDTPPLAVRMTYLPDSKIIPIPTPDKLSPQHAARIAIEKGLARRKEQAADPAQVATVAAIDAFKKQQLSAIQSDRQTLKALQDAISSLGLQKQLDFMTATDGSLSASSGQNAGTLNNTARPSVQ